MERTSLLELAPITVGRQWARLYREELRSEGRRATGGWPGTMAEARARTSAHLAGELQRLRLDAPSCAEMECAARAAYSSARIEWLSSAEPEESADVAARRNA